VTQSVREYELQHSRLAAALPREYQLPDRRLTAALPAQQQCGAGLQCWYKLWYKQDRSLTKCLLRVFKDLQRGPDCLQSALLHSCKGYLLGAIHADPGQGPKLQWWYCPHQSHCTAPR
jgi:hypothetical protein